MFTRKACLLFTLVVASCYLLSAQGTMQIMCNTQAVTQTSTQHGGRFITASGSLNVLFVYVQFPDDNYLPSSPYWPKGQAPIYMNTTVDQVWSANPTPGGFTDYFNQMSFNTLKITGSSVSVITPHTRQYYLDNGWQSTDIHREVLQQLDATLDFAQFDHWHYNSEYSQTNSADGVVDMILMMWRNIASELPNYRAVENNFHLVPGGEASLGGSYTGSTSFTVDNGTRTIKMSYGEDGSGITAIQPVNSDLSSYLLWRYARHEFGHWLLGGNEYHTQTGTYGLLSSYGTPGDVINSFERERLGWKDFITINFADYTNPTTITNLTLPDFVSTGIAYRMKIPGGGTDEYYLLENHQRISVFDVPDNNAPSAKGLFVLHQLIPQGNGISLISAQGRFNWTVPYQLPDIYNGVGTLPVFQRLSANRVNGYSKRDQIPWTWQGIPQASTEIYYYLDFSTSVLRQAGVNGQGTIFTGDGKDQFDLSNNTVFTPSSNPSSDIYNNNKIGFEITGINNGLCVINVFINTLNDTSPSKPQNLSGTYSTVSSVALAWKANLEYNMTHSGNHHYDIYRSIYYDGYTPSYIKINTTTITSPSFVDNSPAIPTGIPASKDVYWRYNVIATDNSGKVSVASEDVWVFVGRTVAGTISNTSTWVLNQIQVGNVTVNSGATLTISPGVVVRSYPSVSLTLNGVLNAQGTSTSMITFTSTGSTTPGSWGSINFYGSGASGSILNYVKMQYGTEIFAQDVPGWGVQVLNSTIEKTINGVRYHNTNGWITDCTITNPRDHGIIAENYATAACYRNIITKTDYTGFGILYQGGSHDYCWKNRISGFNQGLGAIWGSSPTLGHPVNARVNNHITGCLSGLVIYNWSYPLIGLPSNETTHSNSVHNCSQWAAWIYNCPDATTIYAQNVYWGTTDPVALSNLFYLNNVSFNYSNPLSSCPWSPSLPKIASLSGESGQLPQASMSSTTSSIQSNDEDVLSQGINLRLKGKYAEAKEYFKSVLKKQPKNIAAYIELYKTQNDTTKEDIQQYFASLPVEAPPVAKLLLSNIYLKNGDVKSAKQVNNMLIKQNLDSKVSTQAKLNNFYIGLYNDNNSIDAENILNDALKNSEPSAEIEFSLANQALEIYRGIVSEKGKAIQKENLKEVAEIIPAKFELLQNYPNPFNPTTVIRYQLPAISYVKLSVYDMLGREMAILVDGMKDAGSYSTSFDGSKLTSGVYFTRMIAQPQDGLPIVQVRKMLLTK